MRRAQHVDGEYQQAGDRRRGDNAGHLLEAAHPVLPPVQPQQQPRRNLDRYRQRSDQDETADRKGTDGEVVPGQREEPDREKPTEAIGQHLRRPMIGNPPIASAYECSGGHRSPRGLLWSRSAMLWWRSAMLALLRPVVSSDPGISDVISCATGARARGAS